MRLLKVGIVGANWGITHVEAWRRLPNVEVLGICTSRRNTAKEAASRHSIPLAYWNADDLIANDAIDIVDLTPRPSIRTPIALAALDHGKHLMQCLPFADTFDNGRALAKKALDSNRVAMVENLHLYMPAFRMAKEMIQDGSLGEICTIFAQVRADHLINPDPDYVYSWILQKGTGASVLRNYGAHLLHCLTWMFGPIAGVAGRNLSKMPEVTFSDGSVRPNETADTASMVVDFYNGSVGLINLCWCTPAADGFLLDVVGTRGRFVLTAEKLGPANAVLMAAGCNDKALKPVDIPERLRIIPDAGLHYDRISQARGFPLSAMCHQMATAVRQEQPTVAAPDFRSALEIFEVIEAAELSSQNKSWLPIKSSVKNSDLKLD